MRSARMHARLYVSPAAQQAATKRRSCGGLREVQLLAESLCAAFEADAGLLLRAATAAWRGAEGACSATLVQRCTMLCVIVRWTRMQSSVKEQKSRLSVCRLGICAPLGKLQYALCKL